MIQEWDLSCGAAALATILAFQHGDAVSEREIAKAMLAATDQELVRRRLGFSLLDLKRFSPLAAMSAKVMPRLSWMISAGCAGHRASSPAANLASFVVFRGLTSWAAVLAEFGLWGADQACAPRLV